MISPKLIELLHLEYLDLSRIDFSGTQFPVFIGSLTKLRHLDLYGAALGGQFPSQVRNLTHLQYLDLGSNDFTNIVQIFNLLPHLSSLEYLDLTNTNLSNVLDWAEAVNKLPKLTDLELGGCDLPSPPIRSTTLSYINSSKSLAHVDLSGNYLTSSIFPWLSNYNTSLVYLDLTSNHLTFNLDVFGTMTSLAYLYLYDSYLTGSIPDVFRTMTSLTHLDLNKNHLTGSIPDVFGNMSSLAHLDLSFNQFKGGIPHSFSSLCSLQTLNLYNNSLSGLAQLLLSSCAQNSLEFLCLSHNDLEGPLPNRTNFLSLKRLFLDNNKLKGRVPESIWQLSKLEQIDLADNDLDGVISETHFSRLSKLSYLDLSFNSLVLNFSSDWIPPFQLDLIQLASCKMLGPHFPKWLQTQKQYSFLDISDAGISDIVPSWFWDLSPNLIHMNISHNQIRGTIFSNSTVEFKDNPQLDLSWNQLEVLFSSSIFPQASYLDLSNNNISGTISSLFSWNQLEGPVSSSIFPQASYLDLSNNNISGTISSLCDSEGMNSPLSFLSLSRNKISGELPDCLRQLDRLVILDLSNNALSGQIPTTIGSLFQIKTLKLRNNKFVGELPSSLKNCTSLIVLDVGENELSGSVPKWLGVSLQNLVVLIFSSNHFNGSMPSELCHLSHIQILDFSMNNISGSIPKCLSNLAALSQRGTSNLRINHFYVDQENHYAQDGTGRHFYYDDATFIWKGSMRVYKNTLGLVKRIDLSSNRFTGEIPSEITHLVGLVSLNLSRNHLTGQIPLEIGKLDSLDSLDFSRNRIDGRIPESLARIDRLGFLDLSYNNLSGKIPTGTQLQGFDSSVYAENPQLCGPPLKNLCDSEQTVVSNVEEEDKLISGGFYISMAVGFAVGFWGVCGSLIFIRSWRYAYFKFLNVLDDWLYVRVALIKLQLKHLQRQHT